MTLVKSLAFLPIVDNDKQVCTFLLCDIARICYLAFCLQ